MCGIWAIFGGTDNAFTRCNAAYKIAHRGPDAFRLESIYQFPSCCLGFHSLAIKDSQHVMQPMRLFQYPHIWLIYDGNLYNHKNLQEQYDFSSHSDGETIIRLYIQGGIEFAARHLDGVFAFCLLDTVNRTVYLGRDTFGVKPLFRTHMEDGVLSVCSEVKGLMDIVEHSSKEKIQHVLPGHVETYSLDMKCRVSFECMKEFHQIGDIPSYTTVTPKDEEINTGIRTFLKDAIRKRMTGGHRIGCLLSGGLDSSLMTALIVQVAKEQNIPYPIRTYSIGMDVSPDIAAARKVAKHLGTEHHEIMFTAEEAVATIEKVIYYLENYDPVTIRGAIGMYLVCKHVKDKTDTTVIFSGDGADEIAQGYSYFHKAPTVEEGDKESRKLCKELCLFDLQRVDRIPAAFGLAIRVPYLDHMFSSFYLSIDPKIKAPTNGIEKHLMRSAFEDTDLLPREILWRTKVLFSDGLTSNKNDLCEIVEDFAREKKKKSELETCIQQYPHNTPISMESLVYRQIFEKFFSGQGHLIPNFWIAKWSTP